MRSPLVAVALMLALVSGAASGCGQAGGRNDTDAVATGNERRLTHAQSVRLVEWATDFRSCMVARGARVGPLARSETRLEMRLPAGVGAPDVLPEMEQCGEGAGGPPQGSSLQYRPGRILLYLPKRCLLDEKVAAA